MNQPLDIVQKYWRFSSFRGKQETIIEAILSGTDTFALLPTGGGKSLCYQVPALMKEGICIVVSPLIALMTDQVESLKQRGIKALSLAGNKTQDQLIQLLDNAQYGNYKFLYLSPERLQQEVVINAIRRMNVNLLAVDEAHCISQWGNDFRPAYSHIANIREFLVDTPLLALTATANSQVLEDCLVSLKMKNLS